MYDRMAQEAKEEGFDHIAYLFTEVEKIEKTVNQLGEKSKLEIKK